MCCIGTRNGGYIKAELFLEYDCMKIIHNLIYLFHMPLFFCVSGMTCYYAYFRKKAMNKFKIQVINIVWLYFLFSILHWLLASAFSGDVNTKMGLSDLCLIPIKPIGEYWYLYSLIIFYLLSLFIVKLDDSKKWIGFIIVFLISCLNFFIDYKGIILEKALSASLYNFPFFYLGIIFGKEEAEGRSVLEKSALMYSTIILTMIVMIGAVIFFNIDVHGIAICSNICALVATVGIISLFRKFVSNNILQK